MKKRFCLLLAVLFILAASACAGLEMPTTGQTLAGFLLVDQKEWELSEGLRLLALNLRCEAEPRPLYQQLFLLEVRPGIDSLLQARISTPEKGLRSWVSVVKAMETCLAQSERTGFAPLIAINGDFFDTASGGALGLMVSDGRLLLSPEFPGSPSLALTKNMAASIRYPAVALSFSASRAGQKLLTEVPIDALNHLRGDVPRGKSAPNNAYESRQDNRLVLYTQAFYRSTMQPDGGTEVLLKLDHPDEDAAGLPLSGEVKAKVVQVFGSKTRTRAGTGQIAQGTELKKGHMVLSAMPGATEDLMKLKTGDEITLHIKTDGLEPDVRLALGGGRPDGGPLLVQDGQFVPEQTRVEDYRYFYPTRHARTAAGVRADGSWFVLVVQGYQQGLGEGLSIGELAAIMQALGAENALNLDGGASSTLAVLREDGVQMLVGVGRRKDMGTQVGNVLVLGLAGDR